MRWQRMWGIPRQGEHIVRCPVLGRVPNAGQGAMCVLPIKMDLATAEHFGLLMSVFTLTLL